MNIAANNNPVPKGGFPLQPEAIRQKEPPVWTKNAVKRVGIWWSQGQVRNE